MKSLAAFLIHCKCARVLQPFFVIGVGRSGTTLLRLMLNAHSKLAIPYETDFLDTYATLDPNSIELDGLVDRLLGEPSVKRWGCQFDREALLQRASDATHVSEVLSALYLAYAESVSKVRWGDKSAYADTLPSINRLFPNSKFIHLVRDGRDVANSVLKLDWGPKDIVAAAEWWAEHVRLIARMGAILGDTRYLEVRYEDLVLQPHISLRNICDFLQEEFEPQMLEYHKTSRAFIPSETGSLHHNTDRPVQTNRVFAWKREMRSVDVSLFNRYARGMLREYGYQLDDLSVGRWRMYLRLARIFAWRFFKAGSR